MTVSGGYRKLCHIDTSQQHQQQQPLATTSSFSAPYHHHGPQYATLELSSPAHAYSQHHHHHSHFQQSPPVSPPAQTFGSFRFSIHILKVFLLTILISSGFLLISIYYLGNQPGSEHGPLRPIWPRHHLARSVKRPRFEVNDSSPSSSRLFDSMSQESSWQEDVSDFPPDGASSNDVPPPVLSSSESTERWSKLGDDLNQYLSGHVSLLAAKAHKQLVVIKQQIGHLLEQFYQSSTRNKCQHRIRLMLISAGSVHHNSNHFTKYQSLFEATVKRWRDQPSQQPRQSEFEFIQEIVDLNINSISSSSSSFDNQNLTLCDIAIVGPSMDPSMARTQLNPHQLTFLVPHHFSLVSSISPNILCDLFNLVRKYPVFLRHPLAPLCFSLPANFQTFLDVSDALGYSTKWTLEWNNGAGGSSGGPPFELVNIFERADRNRLLELNQFLQHQQQRHLSLLLSPSLLTDPDQHDPRLGLAQPQAQSNSPILWQHFTNCVQMSGIPIQLRLTVLVTSVNPLRAFLYSDGSLLPYGPIVSGTKNFTLKNQPLFDQKNSIEKFWTYLKEQRKFTNEQLSRAQVNIRRSILHSLLLIEIGARLSSGLKPTIVIVDNDSTKSFNWEQIQFQLFAFDVVLENNLQAYVVNIFSLENVPTQPIWSFSNPFPSIAVDQPTMDAIYRKTLQLLMGPLQTTAPSFLSKLGRSLNRMLERDLFGLLGVNCHISHRTCLSELDLRFVLETWAQNNAALAGCIQEGQPRSPCFSMLYPVSRDLDSKFELRPLFDDILLHIDQIEQKKLDPSLDPRSGSQSGPNSNRKLNSHKFDYSTERLHPILVMLVDEMEHLGQSKKPHPHSKLGPKSSRLSAITSITNGPIILNNFYNLASEDLEKEKDKETRIHSSLCTQDFSQISHLSELRIVNPSHLAFKKSLPLEDAVIDSTINENQRHHARTHFFLNQSANHQDLIISILVSVSHCNAWIRLENQFYLQTGVLNFTLGIGENQIQLPIVIRGRESENDSGDITTAPRDSPILSTYTITVNRRSRVQQYEMAPSSSSSLKEGKVQICSLVQDCSLRIYPELECGLQPTGYWLEKNRTTPSTNDWVNHFKKSVPCKDCAANGRWLVPCKDCNQNWSCLWSQLHWIPYDCRYSIPVDSGKLTKCLTNKKVLMIGDSTNRGMLHYILERLNGTLTEADKTHDYKSYHLYGIGGSGGDGMSRQLAQPRTNNSVQLNFAYYPKFWLPPAERPSFQQVLAKLIKLSIGLSTDDVQQSNGSNLVIIFGGVQWIARKHLQIVTEQLKRMNLTKAKVVVKSVGSGFHQPANGVHFMSLNEQIKMAAHNQQIVSEARHLGVEVIDTFNKTIALYQDFYPGKCACHFHRITKLQRNNKQDGTKKHGKRVKRRKDLSHPVAPSDSDNEINNPTNDDHYIEDDGQTTTYHVEGKLNQLYTEILLSQIC